MDAIDRHVKAEQDSDDEDGGAAGMLVPAGQWPTSYRQPANLGLGIMALTWALTVERVTRIELALSAWEAELFRLVTGLTC